MAGKGLPPERVRAVLDLLASGVSPNRAAGPAGVSVTYAYGLHHKMGGVYRPVDTSCSDRYLDREERYEIARLRGAGLSGRVIAARPGRSPSTVSRELARNRDPRTGQYMPERAARSPGRSRPASGPPGSRAAWSPATTRATCSRARRRPAPPSPPWWSG